MVRKIPIFLIVFLFLAITGLSHTADALDCIDINTALKEELVKIKQIGEVRAEQIVVLRGERLFSSVEDLDRVIGIGPARITDIKEQGLACVLETGKPAEDGPPPLPTAITSATTTKITLNSTEPSSDLARSNHGASLLLPIAIFTSFASGGIILMLKRYVRSQPR